MPFDNPIKSSRLLLVNACPSCDAGEASRCGVPARPSSPDMPEGGDFCAEAGAAPSKSMSRRFSMLDWEGGGAPETAAAAVAAARGFSRAFCSCSLRCIVSGRDFDYFGMIQVTYSMAAFCTASAPYLPWPIKDSGGLWYTEARVDNSVSNRSSRAGGRDWMVDVIGGFSDRIMFCAIWALLESNRQYTYARSRTSGLSFSAVAA